MKKYLLLLLVAQLSLGQSGAPANPYYNGMNWSQTGLTLKNSLSTLTINKHTNFLSYTPEVWEASRITDLDPTDNTTVNLIYGYTNEVCPTSTTDLHRKRDKFSNGGGTSCEWNREHVYAKSLGTPALVDGGSGATSDAGEDAHHIRPADVDWNNNRGSEKFVNATGNSRDITATTWYPGDEWKGDVARMMMYMYLRYPTQCLPINVGEGIPVSNDSNMIDLFLKWNAEDPVSQIEDNRNTYHGSTGTYAQGNRNPFIDNPYLATVIWGGTSAQNRWPTVFLSSESFLAENAVSIYPNPTTTNEVDVFTTENITKLTLININGQIIKDIENPIFNQNTYKLSNLPQGFYFLQVSAEKGSLTKKIIVN